MPLIAVLAAVVALAVLVVAVLDTVRLDALRGGHPGVSLTWRAYGA